MHQSRVYALLIDTPEAQAAPAAAFWSAALDATARPVPQEPQFTLLHQALPGLVTAVQAVGDPPRFHLDVETDNVEAETARLLALGAEPVSQWLECRVLQAPGRPPFVRHPCTQRPRYIQSPRHHLAVSAPGRIVALAWSMPIYRSARPEKLIEIAADDSASAEPAIPSIEGNQSCFHNYAIREAAQVNVIARFTANIADFPN